MSASKRNIKSERGIALLVVLVFVALMAVLVTEFSFDAQVDASVAQARVSDLDARIAARSAVAYGMSLLTVDLIDQQTNGDDTDSYIDAWAFGVPIDQMNEAYYRCRIADECGKINLNALIRDNVENEQLVATLRALFDARAVEINPTDAILDWIDTDDQTRAEGAEIAEYEANEMPYKPPADGVIRSLDELFLIPGITLEVYFGIPEEEQFPLSDLLTVFGDPNGNVNVNTALPEVLNAINVVTNGDLPDGTRIMEEREREPFRDRQDFEARLGKIPSDYQWGAKTRRNRGQEGNETEGGGTNVSENQSGEDETPLQKVAPYRFNSDRFRIQGDALAGEKVLRAEAFVLRGGGGVAPVRLIDWRMIE